MRDERVKALLNKCMALQHQLDHRAATLPHCNKCEVLQQQLDHHRQVEILNGKRLMVVLQCVAVCCSVLQCVAVCCSVLQRVAVNYMCVCCSVVCHVKGRRLMLVLQCVAVCCSVLQCVAVRFCLMRSLLPQILVR